MGTPNPPSPQQESEKGVPFLPRLKKGTQNGLAINQARVWDDGQGGERIQKLSDAIATRTEEQAEHSQPVSAEIHSNPDPWGRILLFASALYEKTHPMKSRIVGEWKGLLALLALHEMRHIKTLSIREVDLSSANTARGAGFSGVLARLVPDARDFIEPETTFQHFFLLKVLKAPNQPAQVFGMTSPSTLVATGAFYEDLFNREQVPWFDGKFLTDPAPYLNQREKAAVAQWLTVLMSRMPRVQAQPAQPAPNEPAANENRNGILLGLLRDFAHSLDPSANHSEGVKVISIDRIRAEVPIKRQPTALFELLLHGHAGENDLITELEIVTRDGRPTGYVIIDRQISPPLTHDDGKTKQPNEIMVYYNRTLATAQTLLNSSASFGEFATQRADDVRMYWCTPRFFFEDVLLYEKIRDEFPGCKQARTSASSSPPGDKPREILFPLTENSLRLFSPTELAEDFSIQWHPDGSAVCRLAFKVQAVRKVAAAGQETPAAAAPVLEREPARDVVIEKFYALGDTRELDELHEIPPVCIWPNFRFKDEPDGSNRWNRYYFFESWGGKSDTSHFAVRPLAGNTDKSRMITLEDNRRKVDNFQVTQMKRFPEVLLCTMPGGKTNTPRASNSRPPQGLLLLAAPPIETPGPGRAITIGIDFGTTGTCVYSRFGGDERDNRATPVRFTDRLFRVAGIGDQNAFRRLMRKLFIPAGTDPDLQGKTPDGGQILSIFQIFPLSDRGPVKAAAPDAAQQTDVLEIVPVTEGHVLFPTMGDVGEFYTGGDGSIHSDMKWGGTAEKVAAISFLTQIGMESLAELVKLAVNQVDFLFSYPTAFGIHEEGDEKSATLADWSKHWDAVIGNLSGVSNIPIRRIKDKDNQRCPEAIAASRYFAALPGKSLSAHFGAVTLDIGGGTTDIAVWNTESTETGDKPALKAHLSVLFAGRNVFLRQLKDRPEILSTLDAAVPLERLKEKKGQFEDKAYVGLLNAVIAAHGDSMCKKLSLLDSTPPIAELLRILEIGLCGVAFYAGLLVGKLIQVGDYATKGNETNVPIFIGGNGSKLFHWWAKGEFDDNTAFKFSRSFQAGVAVAAPQQKITVSITLSKKPKEEVAAGLVAQPATLVINNKYTEPMAGEVFRKWNSAADNEWSEPITAADVTSGEVKIDETGPIFTRFLNSLDKKGLQFSFDQDEIKVYCGKAQTALSQIETAITTKSSEASSGPSPEEKLRRLPVFFHMLDSLLDERVATPRG